VQQGGEDNPISGIEPDLVAVQVPFEDRDLVSQGQDSASLARSLRGSRRSIASALVTPRYADRVNTARHPRPVILTDTTRLDRSDLSQDLVPVVKPAANRADVIAGIRKIRSP
jgi:hypothetical protein